MRTTLTLDDERIEKARRLSGLRDETALVQAGLEALSARDSARRLSTLAGSEPEPGRVRRRRSERQTDERRG